MSVPPTACMILAAGFGTRMGALTADRPKPLIEVAGRALIDHALDHARAAGAGPVAVNGHYRAAQLAAHLARRPGVHFLHETPAILDSGGGVRNALSVLGRAPLWVLNADAVWTGPNPLTQLARAWDPARMDALLLLTPPDRAVGRTGGGDYAMDGEARLRRDQPGGAYVFTGASIIDPACFGGWPEGPFSLRDIWDALERRGRLFGTVHGGGWADVGHPGGIALAEAMLDEARDVS